MRGTTVDMIVESRSLNSVLFASESDANKTR